MLTSHPTEVALTTLSREPVASAAELPVGEQGMRDELRQAAGRERHRRAWLSTVTASGFSYVMTAISFVAVPLYLRWLGVDAYGRFLTLLAFMGYLNFADAGVNWGALVLIGQAHGRGDKAGVASLFRHAAVLALFSAAAAMLVAMLVYGLSATGHRLPMFAEGPAPGRSLLLIGIKSAFMLSASSVMAMAYGLQEGYWFARLQGFFQLLGAGLMLAAAYWTREIDAVVAASALASGCACVATLALAARRYAEYVRIAAPLSLDSFGMQLRTGAKSFLLQGSRLVRTTMPVFLIASFAGSGGVPTLTLPLTLLGVVGGFLFNWSASLQTAYGEAWAKGDKPWIAATIRQVIERGLGWLLLASVLIATLGQSFVQVWTGGQVVVPATMLASAVALVAASWITDICIFALVGINRQRRIALVELLNVGLATGAGWLLCVSGHPALIGFGVLGAAVTTTLWVGRKQLIFWLETNEFQPTGRALVRFALAAGCALIVLLAVRSVLSAASSVGLAWLEMAATGLAGVLAFFASLVALEVPSEQWPGFDWKALIKRRTLP
jgi:O-antigen/teichoic acid export membrane protein